MGNPTGGTNLVKYEKAVLKLEEEREKYAKIKNKETDTANKKNKLIIDLGKELIELNRNKNVVILSQTCKTWIKDSAKEYFYGYKSEITGKMLDKGHINEDTAILRLNYKLGTNFSKNEVRKENGWLTGECDIDHKEAKTIRDIKNAWSMETFPAFEEDVNKKVKEAGYDYQQKGYLILWKYERAFIDYCFTPTPEDLLSSYDNMSIHTINEDLDAGKYITTSEEITLEEGEEKEIKNKHKYAELYFNECLAELNAK
tara:strand:- start:13910 stop:14680 length:771 start_codon:yes stop_codon:yes gene_type:complete